MNIQIETGDTDTELPRSIVPPPDYTSRTIRLRLMMLFGMLIVVMILMKEAGKPDNWKWMGFNEEATEQELTGDPTMDDSPTTIAEPAMQPIPQSGPAANEKTMTVLPNGSGPLLGSAEPGSNYPVMASRFWSAIIDKMSSEQHRELFRFLKAPRQGKVVGTADQPAPLSKFEDLIEIVIERRQRFHQEAFDRLATLADGSADKTELADQMFESQSVWEKLVLPAFTSALKGEDITLGQQRQIQRLQAFLDQRVLDKVQDRSSIGWRGDSTPWIRLWERVVDQDFDDPQPVSQLQLISQPEFYRGKAVEIEGWVRSARKDELENSELGLAAYYVLWLRPADTKIAPYCVYSITLPDDFPAVSTEFQDFNVAVRVTGLFFKVRSFVDAERQVRESPVILTDRMEIVPKTVTTSVNAWQPSRTTLVTLFCLIPIGAALTAWLVYRGSETRPYQPGRTTTSRIESTLDQLKSDPTVQTAQQKIMELYQSDGDDDRG